MSSEEKPVEAAKSDEIPPITYRKVQNCQAQVHQMKKCADKKIARFFISDLFNAQCTQKKRFTVKGVDFRNVMICGTVVSTYEHSEQKCIFTVDDGTGEMDCFVENDDRIEELKETVDKESVFVETEYKSSEESDVLLQASLMMLSSAKHTLKKVPHYKHINIGDTVQIIGNLSDYKNKRYLFTNSVIRHEENSADFTANYLDSLYNLYENVYEN